MGSRTILCPQETMIFPWVEIQETEWMKIVCVEINPHKDTKIRKKKTDAKRDSVWVVTWKWCNMKQDQSYNIHVWSCQIEAQIIIWFGSWCR